MVTMNLSDPNCVENFKTVYELQKLGVFSDEEIQKLYDKQVEHDKEVMKGELEDGRERYER